MLLAVALLLPHMTTAAPIRAPLVCTELLMMLQQNFLKACGSLH
jgi:hypothetical protein